jgi:hypothetical protein
MSKAKEFLQTINEEYDLVGSSDIEADLQDAAESLVSKWKKEIAKEANKVIKKNKLDSKAQVRTEKEGVKAIELALGIFASEFLNTEYVGGSPKVNLVY